MARVTWNGLPYYVNKHSFYVEAGKYKIQCGSEDLWTPYHYINVPAALFYASKERPRGQFTIFVVSNLNPGSEESKAIIRNIHTQVYSIFLTFDR